MEFVLFTTQEDRAGSTRDALYAGTKSRECPGPADDRTRAEQMTSCRANQHDDKDATNREAID